MFIYNKYTDYIIGIPSCLSNINTPFAYTRILDKLSQRYFHSDTIFSILNLFLEKTKPSLSDTDEEEVSKRSSPSPSPGPSKPKTIPSLMKRLSGTDPLPTFMSGVGIYFHCVPDDTEKNLRRYLCAYPFGYV